MTIVAYDAGPDMPQPTGVGIYVRHLGTALKMRYGDRIRVFGSRRDGNLAPIAERFMRVERYQVWMQRWASADAAATGADVAHFTNAVAPIRAAIPYVVTIHDVSLLRHPRYHPFRRVASAPVMLWAAQRARRVVVPSDATADEVHKLLRVPARRIAVVEHGAEPAAASVPQERARALLDELGIGDTPYVLSINTLEPRKNIHRLIAAFERLERTDLRLVLLGRPGWHTSVIDRSLARSTARDRIDVIGYVSDEARRVLLERCTVFAYVSIYEGYGLPIVEAMAAGAPVVASNVSSMPQAAGGAAVLVDPYDVRAIADGIRDAIARRDELVPAGRERVSRLSWDRAAEETMAAYEAAAHEAT